VDNSRDNFLIDKHKDISPMPKPQHQAKKNINNKRPIEVPAELSDDSDDENVLFFPLNSSSQPHN